MTTPVVDVIPLETKTRAILLYSKNVKLPEEACKMLLAQGYIPIQVDNLSDVKILPLAVTHDIAGAIDAAALAAFKAIAAYRADGGPPGLFGSELARLLIASKGPSKKEN